MTKQIDKALHLIPQEKNYLVLAVSITLVLFPAYCFYAVFTNDKMFYVLDVVKLFVLMIGSFLPVVGSMGYLIYHRYDNFNLDRKDKEDKLAVFVACLTLCCLFNAVCL